MRWINRECTGRNAATILVALLGATFVSGLLLPGVGVPFDIAIGTGIAVAILSGTQGRCRPRSSSLE